MAGLAVAVALPAQAQTYTRTETITYYDDTAHWVLGQIAQVKCVAPTSALPSGCGASGTVMSATTYDTATALPLTVTSFGKLQKSYTYDLTSTVASGQRGTLKTVTDGNNHATTYSGWTRGVPQQVSYADGSSQSAAVDGNGWVTAVTNEAGFTTSYAYDSMGRISQVTYPTGDTMPWVSTDSAFESVGIAEYGVAAGHWRQTVHTGNGYKVTLFDGLWRPVLVHEFDSGASGTDRWTTTAYDSAGRVADASYPMASAPTMLASGTWQSGSARPKGIRTSYDALDRPVLVQQDSELPSPLNVLNTTTEYLTGFQRRVTDARGNATTEQFMAWDSPTFDLPVQIDAPEGQSTTITRDIFGKPTAITRGGGL